MKKSTVIDFIRHMPSEANYHKVRFGNRDFYLRVDDKHIKLLPGTEALMDKFSSVMGTLYRNEDCFRFIYRSDTDRTEATTAGLVKNLVADFDYEIIVDPWIGEKQFGDWNGLNDEARALRDPELFKAYTAPQGKFRIAPPGGESWIDVQKRGVAFLHRVFDLAEQTGVRHISVVSHSVTLSTMLGALGHNSQQQMLNLLPLNGSVYRYTGKRILNRFVADKPIERIFDGFEVLAPGSLPALKIKRLGFLQKVQKAANESGIAPGLKDWKPA